MRIGGPLVLSLALAAAAGLALETESMPPPEAPLADVSARPPPAAAPDIRLVSRGSAASFPARWLADPAGDVFLVHFWASWCRPCEAEMESLLAFYAGPYGALRDRGLVLLSVSNDVRMKDVRGFAEEHAVPFPIFYDSLRELNDRLRMPWIPGSVVIDRSGAVVDRLYGEQDWQSEALLARLENHLLPQQNPGKEKR